MEAQEIFRIVLYMLLTVGAVLAGSVRAFDVDYRLPRPPRKKSGQTSEEVPREG